MRIRYHSSNFNATDYPDCVTGWRNFDFSLYELVIAAIEVGREDRWDVVANGIYSFYEIIYRAGIILANIKQDRDGYVIKTPAYERLDPTEKGAISYFLGMAMSKLMAEKKLKVPFLMHLEVYQTQIEALYGPVYLGRGKSRPDLIGLDENYEWVVMESKGRTSIMSNPLMIKAKAQAVKVRSVGGQVPKSNVAAITYFEDGKMRLKWEDPVSDAESMDFDFITLEDIIRKYYQPFWSLTKNPRLSRTLKTEYRINLVGLDLVIRMPIQLAQLYREEPINRSAVIELLNSIRPNENEIKTLPENVIQTSDGLRFEFGESWSNRLSKFSN